MHFCTFYFLPFPLPPPAWSADVMPEYGAALLQPLGQKEAAGFFHKLEGARVLNGFLQQLTSHKHPPLDFLSLERDKPHCG